MNNNYGTATQYLIDIFRNDPLVNTIIFGELSGNSLNKNDIYSLVHINPAEVTIEMTQNNADFINLTFEIAVVDIRTQPNTAQTTKIFGDNLIDNLNTTLQIVTNGINLMKNSTVEDVFITSITNVEPIIYSDIHLLDGFQFNVVLSILNNFNNCDSEFINGVYVPPTLTTQPNQPQSIDISGKVDKELGKSLILDSEINRLSSVTNQNISGKVDKEEGKSLILDSEINRLSSVTNQNISGKVDKELNKSLILDSEINRLSTVTNQDITGKANLNDSRIVASFAEKVNSISVTGDTNKTITLTKEDGTILTATFLDNNFEYPDDVINSLTFNANNDGVLIAITSEGQILSVSMDGRYSLIGHSHTIAQIVGLQTTLDTKQNILESGTTIKTINGENLLGSGNINIIDTNTTYTGSLGITLLGTDFRPNYGILANTIVQGNDSRIVNGQTAFGWGNHFGLYSVLNHVHSIGQVTGLQAELNGKANLSGGNTFNNQQTFQDRINVNNVGSGAFISVASFFAPNNIAVGNNTQLKFGISDTTKNSADWRFFYSTSNSNLNRVDFGFSGVGIPIFSYNPASVVMINTTIDNGVDKLIVNGTISASPATLSTQLATLGQVQTALDTKQNILESGTSIKTINGENILGSGNIIISGGSGGAPSTGPITLTGVTLEPTPPPTNELLIYSKLIANRMVLKQVGPAGLDTPLQNAFWQNNITLWTPTNATNGIWQGTVGTSSGTYANTLPTQVNRYTMLKRSRYANVVTTLNQVLGVRNSELMYTIGSIPGAGGFFFYARCGFETFPLNGGRAFVGFTNNSTAVVTQNASTVNNVIGFAIEDTDGQAFSFITRGTTGFTKTNVDIGIGLPNQGFDFYIFCPPGGTTIGWRIVDFTKGFERSGSISTNLPANTVMLTANVLASNGANTPVNSVQLGINRIYVETDY